MSTKLGQNFLKDKSIVEKIIKAANLAADDFVLEIGPGKGILTEALSERAGKVAAVEIDPALRSMLRSTLRSKKNVEIIQGDILKIDLRKILPSPQILSLEGRGGQGGYKLIANIPYYITAPIIKMFLEADLPPKEMILMVQKEVAERIVERPGKMSILAVSVQYYAEPEILFYVPKNSFEPAPEVDSAVIRILPSPPAPLPVQGEGGQRPGEGRKFTKIFFRVVRAGFSAKRKTLANNLSNSFHLEKKEVEEKIKKAGLNPVSRAQELSVDDWKKLSKIF